MAIWRSREPPTGRRWKPMELFLSFTVSVLAGIVRETPIKAFPSPDLRCKAANSVANPCDPPKVSKEMLI